MKAMPVVILCGGQGTRLREETEYRPKPMVTIGGLPILWHIMRIYSHHGFSNFVLCLGYKGEMIKDFFNSRPVLEKMPEDWKITFADTGLGASTGSRLAQVEPHIGTDNFFATYGDAVSDLDIAQELSYHLGHGKTCTLAGVHPHSKFGLVKSSDDGTVESFVEKPELFDYVNGGFYIFSKGIFDYLDKDEGCVLETAPFSALVKKRQMMMFRHQGFWHSMDTYKDYLDLNLMWDGGVRPWKKWK